MKKKNTVIAICYDFDKTLSPSDSSLDFGYFEKLGIDKDNFWNEINKNRVLIKMDDILSYLYYTIYTAKKLNVELTKEDFIGFGKNAYFYNGVEQWFDRINNYAQKYGIKVEHYIISSGIKEVIENTRIAQNFKKIYASSYLYDESNHPIWPTYTINYTNKTQYLYRIEKNALEENDKRVNEKNTENIRIPFENMIYIGDSITDIPCMSIMVKNGGTSIGVYEDLPANKELMLELYKNNRINYYAFADYSENSELDKTVKIVIDNIALREKIEDKDLTL